MDVMQYFYVFLWSALAVMTFIVGRKEGLLAVLIASFFVYMAVWYGIRAFGNVPMFDGVLGIVFKCTLGAFALLLCAVWLIKRRRNK